ncbi:hypothetical protein HYPSUDRAFT_210069 [Hypholoma sublateritium FD-334 SS-4]|uniref:Uncharacterized protein n=1 Tax=Hypholoma sublateritium (strain FD-334 SS-4) TaxID=945553 RepID=A0A0D2N7V6_HYPSF|nr:hypothetical protein HYPSUDRAFT_210069 [Hypholoma sublateritium FD-334 SS-4]
MACWSRRATKRRSTLPIEVPGMTAVRAPREGGASPPAALGASPARPELDIHEQHARRTADPTQGVYANAELRDGEPQGLNDLCAEHPNINESTANRCHLAVPSPDPFYTPSPEDMYTEDKVAEDPSGKIPRRGTEPSMKASVPDLESENYHKQEKYYQDRIQSLEQEVIKLLLENSRIPATGPGLGAIHILPIYSFIPADVPQFPTVPELEFMRMGVQNPKSKRNVLKLRSQKRELGPSTALKNGENPVVLKKAHFFDARLPTLGEVDAAAVRSGTASQALISARIVGVVALRVSAHVMPARPPPGVAGRARKCECQEPEERRVAAGFEHE